MGRIKKLPGLGPWKYSLHSIKKFLNFSVKQEALTDTFEKLGQRQQFPLNANETIIQPGG